MRVLLALTLAAFAAVPLSTSSAEQRIFILAGHADRHGVGRCLASGAPCDAAAAAYCQSKAFTLAASYRKVDRGEITGAVPAHAACRRTGCADFVAIECRR